MCKGKEKCGNKCSVFFVFLSDGIFVIFFIVWVDLNYSAMVVCVVATISAIQEGCYIIKGREII